MWQSPLIYAICSRVTSHALRQLVWYIPVSRNTPGKPSSGSLHLDGTGFHAVDHIICLALF